MEQEYSEAAVEVLDILYHTRKIDVEKIPQSFIDFLIEISSKTYKSKLNHDQPISGLNIKEKTKEILGFIYITWWCSDEKRELYKEQIKNENLKKQNIKIEYIDDIFNASQNNDNKINEEAKIIEYREESKIKKVINRILNFFGIKKNK